MKQCKRCGSYAVNPHNHGRKERVDLDLFCHLGVAQQSIGRTNNHRGPRPTIIITDPKEIEKICLNQPRVSGKRMRESILRQNAELTHPESKH